jgi:hypothetical protein
MWNDFSSCGWYVWYCASFPFKRWIVFCYESGLAVWIFMTLMDDLNIKFSGPNDSINMLQNPAKLSKSRTNHGGGRLILGF